MSVNVPEKFEIFSWLTDVLGRIGFDCRLLIHKEGLSLSYGDINRLMMVMEELVGPMVNAFSVRS
jgi:hypothetical protein